MSRTRGSRSSMSGSLTSPNVAARSPEDKRSVTEAANMDQSARSAMAARAHTLYLPFPNSAASPEETGIEILVADAGVGECRPWWWWLCSATLTDFMARSGLRGRGWNPGPATRVKWEWRLERPVRSLQRLTVGPSYFPLLKCLFRMQEFHRNHVEISQESVQFHRKNAGIEKKSAFQTGSKSMKKRITSSMGASV